MRPFVAVVYSCMNVPHLYLLLTQCSHDERIFFSQYTRLGLNTDGSSLSLSHWMARISSCIYPRIIFTASAGFSGTQLLQVVVGLITCTAWWLWALC